MYLLKISFSPISPANVTDPGKRLQAYESRSQISRVKILALWTKWAQNGGEKDARFL